MITLTFIWKIGGWKGMLGGSWVVVGMVQLMGQNREEREKAGEVVRFHMHWESRVVWCAIEGDEGGKGRE